MKKLVLLFLVLILCCFISVGIYIALSIGNATENLGKTTSFHHVEFLHDELVHNILGVQSGLLFNQPAQSSNLKTQRQYLETLKASSESCSTCHHSKETKKLLDDLRENIELYLTLTNDAMKGPAEQKDQATERRRRAFSQGERLIATVFSHSRISTNIISKRIDAVRTNMHATNFFLISCIVLGSLAVIMISFFFIKRFSNSVDILTEASRTLGSVDLNYRITTPLPNEFGNLAKAFNDMADAINTTLSALLQANDELQHANQMTTIGQMAAGLSHEIKNPLAGIKVSLDVICDELELEIEDKEVFALIINDIDRVERVLKSLLHYAKPPTPQLDLVDINRLLDSSIKNIETVVSKDPAKRIQFEKNYSKELQPVEVDASQFQQVFQNILTNSIEAMKSGGTITTATSMNEDGWIQVKISDTGPGIPDDSKEKIFTPFFTTKRKGTGLGLSICKRLVEQHGGTIKVDSLPGEGSSFVINIPRVIKNGSHIHE